MEHIDDNSSNLNKRLSVITFGYCSIYKTDNGFIHECLATRNYLVNNYIMYLSKSQLVT